MNISPDQSTHAQEMPWIQLLSEDDDPQKMALTGIKEGHQEQIGRPGSGKQVK